MNKSFSKHRIKRQCENVTEIKVGATTITVTTYETNANQKFKPDRTVVVSISGKRVDRVEVDQSERKPRREEESRRKKAKAPKA